MSYVVLARKWRSAQFSEVVGQTHITRTLSNAIRLGRVHHAYLFTGSRGIGKTSIARIFSKLLRCESLREDGGYLATCDQCPACREVTAGNSLDVMEIDGASNNGVDAVRELRDQARYVPASGKRKIYIIDEVHMLTTAAFNALLKTLEEPPAHLVFIFATTEPHKVPATILSRCQRFDFRRIPVSEIQAHLREICARDGISAEPDALSVIARAAEGGMRDALSLLDQVIAYSGGQVTVASARESVGLIGSQILFSVLKPTLARDARSAVLAVTECYRNGVDLRSLTHGLLEMLHAAILAKIGAPRETATEFSDEEWTEIHALASCRELEELELIYQVLHYGLESVARSPQPRLTLQVLVVKCASAEDLVRVTSTPGPNAPTVAITPIAPAAAPQTPTPSTTTTTTAAAKAETPPRAATLGWDSFIQFVQTRRPMLASVLEHGQCPEFNDQRFKEAAPGNLELTIFYPPGSTYYKDQLGSRMSNEALHQFSAELVRAAYPKITPRFKIELRQPSAGAEETPAERKERERREAEARAIAAVKNHPVIQEAQALFGVETGPIELRAASGVVGTSPANLPPSRRTSADV